MGLALDEAGRRIRNLELAVFALASVLESYMPPAGQEALRKIEVELFDSLTDPSHLKPPMEPPA